MIGHDDNDDIRIFCIKLPQMIGYAEYVDSYMTMSFKVSDENLLKMYTKLRGKN